MSRLYGAFISAYFGNFVGNNLCLGHKIPCSLRCGYRQLESYYIGSDSGARTRSILYYIHSLFSTPIVSQLAGSRGGIRTLAYYRQLFGCGILHCM